MMKHLKTWYLQWPKLDLMKKVFIWIGFLHNKMKTNFAHVRDIALKEVELGEFFNKGDKTGELEFCLMELSDGLWKGIIIVGLKLGKRSQMESKI